MEGKYKFLIKKDYVMISTQTITDRKVTGYVKYFTTCKNILYQQETLNLSENEKETQRSQTALFDVFWYDTSITFMMTYFF